MAGITIADIADDTWVRCGVCRDKSIDRRWSRQSNIIGVLGYFYEDDRELQFTYVKHLGPHRPRPADPDNPDAAKRTVGGGFGKFGGGRGLHPLSDGMAVRCRYGHELRVSAARVAELHVSGDGVVYLPGN